MNLQQLQQSLKEQKLDACIITRNNQFIGQDILPEENRKIVEDYQMSATVRCHPKDIFNEEVGKKLAKKKLNERFNRCKMRVLRTLADYANKEYNILMKRIVEKAKKGAWHE